MVDATPAQRFIPGAPPPPPLSKSQKKKRKVGKSKDSEDAASPVVEIPNSTAASLTEKAPTSSDIQNEHVASELVGTLETINENTAENSRKSSPAVEFITKRIKLQTKKASRIAAYASKAFSDLNEDQRKSVVSLPLIQGGIKELEEAKKALELIEAEETKDIERQHAEAEKTTQERITQTVSDTKDLYLQRTSAILSLIRLSAHLNSSEPSTFHLNVNDSERHAIQLIVEALTSAEGPSKEDLLSKLLDGESSFGDVTYERILLIVESFRNPPIAPIEEPITFAEGPEPPASEEAEVEVEPDVEVDADVEVADQVEHGVETAVPMTGSFHFMQESELEETAFEAGAEWVEKPEDQENLVTNGVAPEVVETTVVANVNGGDVEQPPTYTGKLDWAADDINEVVEGGFEVHVHANGDADLPVVSNGVADYTEVDEDGFVRTRSGRGRYPDNRTEYRGRGRGGFRGDRGGDHKGGEYRGGDHRGGEFRGGDHKGGFRSRGDGEFRGRGGFRGGDRGRGDFRGRGRGSGDFRGRGKGGERGERGGFRGGRGGYNENRPVVQPISP